ncbi:DUF5700 domain-containing putative Zn-dependent protease [Hyphobacterium marinum]|uniref:DUF5700 domain-containing putative Zn-dependent protease n=1 Tax=Hyphobacterium marinum TaxID=3116574 RepID=A0ABU7LV16_9PROT|nr:DUF5700 domain-containing putative Zn-dependent protease [Hyphobacterium sp. Y6023]MEE2565409.1 DUF5700 domain-containing putative Zn-dependent protease [Hyphobacterium sp. Y6023]
MMIRTLALAASATLAIAPAALAEDYPCANFTIGFDFTALESLTPILRRQGGEAAIDAALELPSVQAIVRKQTQSHEDRSTAERLREELLAWQSGSEGEIEDPVYPFPDDETLSGMEAVLSDFRADPETLMAPACERLSVFLPADYDTPLNSVFVMGVNSAGFAFGDPVLYIGFHRMYDDLPALELVLVHELYHGAQGAYRPVSEETEAALTEDERRVLDYLRNGYLEGSAMWVADPADFEGDGAMLDYFQTRLERGVRERGNLFTFFEASLYQLANDPTTDPRRHYFAGFTGEERNYNVGYIISRAIEANYGRERLAQVMTEPPTVFYRLYAEAEDRNGPELSETFLAILTDMEAALERAEAEN